MGSGGGKGRETEGAGEVIWGWKKGYDCGKRSSRGGGGGGKNGEVRM